MAQNSFKLSHLEYLFKTFFETEIVRLTLFNNFLICNLRWPISVTTQFKLENTFQYPQHISKLATQLNGYRKHISMSTTHFQTDNTTRYLLKTHFNFHNTFPDSQHNSLVCKNTFQYAQQMHFQTWKQY